MKYNEDYFQVTGVQLPDILKKPFEKKKKTLSRNNFSYSTELINRFQMLYCSHTNRTSGLFRKSKTFIIKISFLTKELKKVTTINKLNC